MGERERRWRREREGTGSKYYFEYLLAHAAYQRMWVSESYS